MNAKRRPRPGAIPRASSAASMGMVPAPQNGSSRGAGRLAGGGVPAGGQEHPGGQGLAEGRLGGGQPVAAAVQQLARRVDADGALVVQQAHDDQLRGVPRVLLVELLDGGRLPQPVADGAGDALGDGIRMIQARFVAGHPQRHRLAGRQVALPGQAGGAPAEIGETHGLELAQAQQHAVGGAQVQVGEIERPAAAGEFHAAVLFFGGARSAVQRGGASGRHGGQEAEWPQLLRSEGRQAWGGDGE